MVVAALLALFLFFGMSGGGSIGELMTEYTKDPIKTTIADEGRRKAALKELSSLKKAIKEFNKGVSKDVKQFDKLVKNYNSTPEEFDQMLSAMLTKNKQEVGNIWEQRSAMLTHIQADEWQTIISGAKAAQEKELAKEKAKAEKKAEAKKKPKAYPL
jgi:ABC-type Na+ efflux pump permease subunit